MISKFAKKAKTTYNIFSHYPIKYNGKERWYSESDVKSLLDSSAVCTKCGQLIISGAYCVEKHYEYKHPKLYGKLVDRSYEDNELFIILRGIDDESVD